MFENSIYVLSFILILTTIAFVFAGAKALSILIKELSTQVKPDLDKATHNQVSNRNTQNEIHLLFEKLRAEIMQGIGQTVSDAVLSRAYFDKAGQFFNSGQYDIALELLNQVIQLNPNDSEAYNLRGVVYFKQENFDQAIVDYSKAIDINPNNKMALYNRGTIYRDVVKNYEKALKDISRIIKITPDDANAYQLRATVYVRMNQDEEAIRDYAQAKTLNPKFASRQNITISRTGIKSLQEIITTYSETLGEQNIDADT